MSTTTEIIRTLCLALPTLNDDDVRSLIGGVSGRGEFGPRLAKWLESGNTAFTETLRIEYPESIYDKGVDVYAEGQSSQAAVGFQIKSENDVQDPGFIQKLKAQITDARAYGKLELYVIVLACSPERFVKVQYVLTQELQNWQSGTPEILTLTPGKAAALWQRFETAITLEEINQILAERNWQQFFARAGAPTREAEFLRSPLSPDERFVSPKNLTAIQQSICDFPLTILSGPPTVGKTFTAVQLLWQHYRQGKPIQWIEPLGAGTAQSIIPASEPTFGMAERTRQLTFRLGLRPPLPPQNRYEFIAARMEPDSLVLIEDPFGMTDADYISSLRSYDFFDLEGCIQAISEGGRQSGCRLVVTTRHGLLERWLDERSKRTDDVGEIPSGVNVIQLTPDDYQPSSLTDESPLVDFAERLLRARGESVETQKLATRIGWAARTPQEVQMVVDELPKDPTKDHLDQSLARIKVGAVERIRNYARASTDADRLFLFMLMTTLQGEEYNDFARHYALLFKTFGLAGDARSKDAEARAKYWPLFYPTVYPENRHPLFRRGVHLKASHPSVVDAVVNELRHNGDGFLDRLVQLVNGSKVTDHRQTIARYAFSEHSILSKESITILATAFPELIKPRFAFSPFSVLATVMAGWTDLPDELQRSFLQTIGNGSPRMLAEVCEMFVYTPMPAKETWHFYELLLKQTPLFGVGEMIAIRHPWEYFIGNLDAAPNSIVQFFDNLSATNPSGFALVMGKLASGFWSQFRPEWKKAILSNHAAISRWDPKTAALRQIFFGLFSYEDSCPEELLQQLYDNLSNPNGNFRALAGSYSLLYWERLLQRFHEALRALFRTEPEPLVLLEILHQGMSAENNAHDLELVSIALERGNDVMAACLLQVLLGKLRAGRNEKLKLLIDECQQKGGDYSYAVLESRKPTDVDPAPSVVSLAHVWKSITDLTSSKAKGDEEPKRLLTLIDELDDQHKQFAYYITAYHSRELPEPLKQFIESLEQNCDVETKETIAEARADDERDRRPKGRALPGFPIHEFGLTIS